MMTSLPEVKGPPTVSFFGVRVPFFGVVCLVTPLLFLVSAVSWFCDPPATDFRCQSFPFDERGARPAGTWGHLVGPLAVGLPRCR